MFHRARVHELLDWDQGSFYKAISSVVYPKVFAGREPLSDDLAAVEQVFRHLEDHVLGEQPFLTDDKPTIADISIAMSATMLQLVGKKIELPRVSAWQQRMTRLQGWTEVNAGFEQWRQSVIAPASIQVAAQEDRQSEQSPATVSSPPPTSASAAQEPAAPADSPAPAGP